MAGAGLVILVLVSPVRGDHGMLSWSHGALCGGHVTAVAVHTAIRRAEAPVATISPTHAASLT
jgi:cytochrome b561